MSLAKNAKNLHTLDLSHCLNLRDRDLALIVSRCLSLRTLKLVGCSQVNNSNKGVSSDQFHLVVNKYINKISSSLYTKRLDNLLDKILNAIYFFSSWQMFFSEEAQTQRFGLLGWTQLLFGARYFSWIEMYNTVACSSRKKTKSYLEHFGHIIKLVYV